MKEGKPDEMFASWLYLPEEQRNTMDAEFRDIIDSATCGLDVRPIQYATPARKKIVSDSGPEIFQKVS